LQIYLRRAAAAAAAAAAVRAVHPVGDSDMLPGPSTAAAAVAAAAKAMTGRSKATPQSASIKTPMPHSATTGLDRGIDSSFQKAPAAAAGAWCGFLFQLA